MPSFIKSIGVNTLWLNPLFESGFTDGGYDLIDFYKVDPRFGTNTDLVEFIKDAHDFIEKYQDRIVYGTDMSFGEKTYKITFRVLETADEHFYEIDKFNYHWPLYGLALSDKTLKKLYRDNAIKIINR